MADPCGPQRWKKAETDVTATTDPLTLWAEARSEQRSLRQLGRLVRSSTALVRSAAPRLYATQLALQVVAAVALAGQVFAVRSLLTGMLAEDASMSGVAAPVAALVTATAVVAVSGSVQGQLRRLVGEAVSRSMWQRVLGVASRVDLRTFESPAFQDRLMRVQTSALSRPYQVTQGLLAAMGALAACVVLGITLVTISPWLLPLVAAAGIPMTLVSRSESRREFTFAVRSTPLVRLRGYFALLLSGRDEAKEVRAFNLGPWLRGRFDGLYEDYLVHLRRHALRLGLLGLLGQTTSALALGSALVAIVWMVDGGMLTVAAAGAGIVAVRFLSTQVQGLFGGLRSIFESGLFLADLDTFLGHAQTPSGEEDGSTAPVAFSRIETSGLTFSYPGTTTPALAGVDITLRAGEVVALVGENGSGKTTLAKLLAGLYRPDEGRITWDGHDTAGFSATSLRERVTVLFQDFVRYALSASDNIRVGRIAEPVDPARMSAAADASGALGFLERLPNRMETPLSPIFEGGIDLSGGQWQRVALARALYRDAPLVILDEPSAALDPRAEHELFAALRSSLHGRTALFISHRFSTVRGADRIYVLDAGQVVEEGAHDDLIARGGRYAELFHLQSEAYVTGQASR